MSAIWCEMKWNNYALRFSIMALLFGVFIVAIGILLIQRFFVVPHYSGPSRDIGDGHSETYYYWNSLGEESRVDVEIDESLTSRQPKWESNEANPPVSARYAVLKANSFIKTKFPSIPKREWSFVSANLTPLDLKKAKWCWVVRFDQQPEVGTTETHSPQLSIFVLMDGSVLEPRNSH